MQKCAKILFLLTILFAAVACNTVRGVGKDVEKAGEKIEESAD